MDLLRNYFKSLEYFEEKTFPRSHQLWLCNLAFLSRLLEAVRLLLSFPLSASLRIMFGLLHMTWRITTQKCGSEPPNKMRCFSHLNGGQYWIGWLEIVGEKKVDMTVLPFDVWTNPKSVTRVHCLSLFLFGTAYFTHGKRDPSGSRSLVLTLNEQPTVPPLKAKVEGTEQRGHPNQD